MEEREYFEDVAKWSLVNPIVHRCLAEYELGNLGYTNALELMVSALCENQHSLEETLRKIYETGVTGEMRIE